MATVVLEFDNPINVSLQRKADVSLTGQDIVFYVNSSGQIIRLGPCIAITEDTISVDVDNNIPRPSSGNYVFFGKDTEAGTSGVVGYFAEIEFKNDSKTKAELYSVSTEYFVSSK